MKSIVEKIVFEKKGAVHLARAPYEKLEVSRGYAQVLQQNTVRRGNFGPKF